MRAKAIAVLGAWLLCSQTGVFAAADARLITAIRAKDVAAVRALLKQRVDVNAPQGDGTTALHWAAHVNDLNATILHCLGIDHSRFTFKFQGLEQKLTGVEEQHVIKELLG